MLYLIKIDYWDRENNTPYSVLTLGYAEDIEKRMKEYNCYNPHYTLLNTSGGTREDESALHKLFSDLRLPDRREWLEYSDKIIEEFQYFKDHGTIRFPKEEFISSIDLGNNIKSGFIDWVSKLFGIIKGKILNFIDILTSSKLTDSVLPTCSYQISEIQLRSGNSKFNRSKLDNRIQSEFSEGECYTRTDLKNKLKKIFEETGYSKIAKTISIEEWFSVLPTSLILNDGKKINVVRLFKKEK